ncbi:nucleotidyltransferase domain-containing protein [Pseudosporangium ferrugineum]|uniref:Nucleotidyltransferase-like protein n=1 Tax=Pseudosporangium ferrugineum TaxID=439699 RepID=A0A2T0RBT4_9ACTN|nr:nucleotidyltransferase domain-containing protein [Pseudosporangium ferrugineum]PRY18625.1 nucleotidyltransferase-like protein [Pseudosporangium ferrugineum]
MSQPLNVGPAAGDPPPHVVEPALQLARVRAARDAWLAEATAVLRADRRVAGTVVVGSLAAGGSDAFSDVDLIVVLDPPIPPVLLADPFAGLGLLSFWGQGQGGASPLVARNP